MSGSLFGTDGIRGVANVAPFTAETALSLGRAVAHICKRHDNRHRIVIGKDTRLSGYMIENALTAGICSMGVDVLLVGPVPTPGISFITHSMRADAGIVISASHNPYQDNGIKIFSKDGFKLNDVLEDEIEDLIFTERISDIRPTAEDIGKAYRIDDAIGRYIVFCKNTFPEDLTLEGVRIVLDCANGATYKVAPTVFSELGAEVTAINVSPNGKNINDDCGSQFTQGLKQKVIETGADIGLAFDGDGDRLMAVDEKGRQLTGDHIIAVCAMDLKDSGELRNNMVVVTPMTNFGIRKVLADGGVCLEEAAVGDRNVLELMIRHDACLGGEQSGHIIFRDYHTTGDGIISALQLLSVMLRSGRKVSELAGSYPLAPQVLVNIPVQSKPALDELDEVSSEIKAAEEELGDDGRVLVRYSGTENICRVMVEGMDAQMVERLSDSISNAVRKRIG